MRRGMSRTIGMNGMQINARLRTPITSLKLFAQMLKKRFERASDNELAQDAAKHLARMDEQLAAKLFSATRVHVEEKCDRRACS